MVRGREVARGLRRERARGAFRLVRPRRGASQPVPLRSRDPGASGSSSRSRSSDPSLGARAEHRYLHGESARKLEHFAEAIPELEIAVARAPDRAEYRIALAQALLDGGKFEAAVGEFSKVVATHPTFENYLGLGSALAETGKADQAMAALREARRLQAGDPRVLLKLGTLAMRAKDLGRAESYLIEARDAAPRHVDVLFALAQVQRLQGLNEDAEQTRSAAEAIKKEADVALERARVFSRLLVTQPEQPGQPPHLRARPPRPGALRRLPGDLPPAPLVRSA